MNHDCCAIVENQIPEIYCAISAVFNKNIDIVPIMEELNRIGINSIRICNPRIEPVTCMNMAIVNNECFWSLDDALTKMFSQVDNCMQELKSVIQQYSGEIYIDIAFYQHGTYPALVFSGDNMKKIHYLDANISIDPF